jgi:hypothetical protein
VAGLLGAYVITFPRARVTSLFFVLFFFFVRDIPAIYFILFWFFLQVINGVSSLGIMGNTTAWWAHIGGFLAGVLLCKLSSRLPGTGLTRRLDPVITRRHTDRLQVVRPDGAADDPHLYGTITVTAREARLGTPKLVNVPWGLHKRLLRVTVPPGMADGSRLRLKGLGRWTAEGLRGDLYLKVAYEG